VGTISAKTLVCSRISCRDKKYEVAKNQGLIVKKAPRKTSKPSKGYPIDKLFPPGNKLKEPKVIQL